MKSVVINLSDKLYYTLLFVGLFVLFGAGVYAFGGTNPAIMGHSAGEIEVTDEFCVKISGHACGYDDTGVAGPDLVKGFRSSSQCTGSGGSVVGISEGKVCKFSGTSCPSGGWARFKSYSSTSGNFCGGSGKYGCSTGGHAFANIGRESCTHHTIKGTGSCHATVTSVGCY